MEIFAKLLVFMVAGVAILAIGGIILSVAAAILPVVVPLGAISLLCFGFAHIGSGHF